jgi:hypothetical protein
MAKTLMYRYIQDTMEMSEIKVESILSIEIVANSMIKGLPLNKFREHVSAMGLRNALVIAI